MTNTDFRSVLHLYANGNLDRERARNLLEASAPPPAASVAPRQWPSRSAPMDIAVIGMAGRFPGASDVREFWRNLEAGRVTVGELPAHYLRAEGPGYRWGGALPDRDGFDAPFFGISPHEADSMDPHQRLLLQEAWHALEDAGHDPGTLRGSRTGMFIGAEPTGHPHESPGRATDAQAAAGLSAVLDLRGPALVVNTTCSSGLVALHLACQSLLSGESSLALAGGVHAGLEPEALDTAAESGMLSPSGECRTFDASADGTVFSEAVAVVVLKRLADAIADGDHIHGVIRATGVNQGGAGTSGAAPDGAAQEQLISEVYQRYGIDPERIGAVEAHGAATPLGDPAEANALARAYRRFSDKSGYCALGSATSHIGHSRAAAGPAGLIKILLSMRHGLHAGLPTLNKPSPLIELDGSAFVLDDVPRPWPAVPGVPRMAAVNSVGHSGTNVHVVVEEHLPADQGQRPARSPAGGPEHHLVPLSAKSPERLRAYADRLAAFLEDAAARTPVAAPEHREPVAPARLRELLAGVLEVESGQIGEDEPFSGIGVEPSHLARLGELLEAESGGTYDPAVAHRARSLTDLARLLATEEPGRDAAGRAAGPDLAAVARTLQHGRAAMTERAAFVVRDLAGLIAGLKALAAGESAAEGCHRGTASGAGTVAGLFAGDPELGEVVGKWLDLGKLDKVAELWVNGVPVDWRAAHRRGGAGRIPLPGYPFGKDDR
ncbi:beta-ketoacyl synthase N-terminal-like domain-containing protein [Streptomyces sp. NPDC007983]|uniref:polyketide synthase n=1 Tax=Streptomyces sp. NPDC007983 TaxID=3364800 RepID=UPI0036DFCB84